MARRRKNRGRSASPLTMLIALAVVGAAVWGGFRLAKPALSPQDGQQRALQAISDFRLQRKIDPRVTVFDITPAVDGESVRISGAIGDAELKQAVMTAVHNAIGRLAVDDLRVLPDPSLGEQNRAIVNIAVANLGDAPGRDTGDHMVTQAILGNILDVLEESNGWYRVRMGDEYLGWIYGRSVVVGNGAMVERFTAGQQAVVTSKFTSLYSTADATSPNVLLHDAVQGTVLPLAETRAGWMMVRLPDGKTGWIPAARARTAASWNAAFPKTDAEGIIAAARQYVGLAYLWGGTSAYGFDCSGFTQYTYRVNGFSLPRDADMQYAAGDVVADRSQLRPGDLVFFSTYKAGPSHVGIYIGEGRYIHSGSAGVAINSFDRQAPEYSADLDAKYLGARRFIK